MRTALHYVAEKYSQGFLDLRTLHQVYSLTGQDVFVNGDAAQFTLHAALGVALDARALQGTGIAIVLGYRWDQYDRRVVDNGLEFTYTDPATGLTERVLVAQGATPKQQAQLVFADGSVLSNQALQAIQSSVAQMADVPEANTTFNNTHVIAPSASADQTLNAFASVPVGSQEGATFAMSQIGQPLVVKGSALVDKVYVQAGSVVDARNLLGGQDQIYFTGQWSDYEKSVNSSGLIVFTRTVGGQQERVTVSNGALLQGRDQLVFADGAVLTHQVRAALQIKGLNVAIHAVAGYDSTTQTPLLSDIASIHLSSTAEVATGIYKQGDWIEFTVQFKTFKAVDASGDVALRFILGNAQKTARLAQDGQGLQSLRFRYQVQADDVDTDGISWAKDAISGGQVVLAGTTMPAQLFHTATADLSAHRVDGAAPAKPIITLRQDNGTADEGVTNDGTLMVDGLEPGAAWQYQLDGGPWLSGTGQAFVLLGEYYGAGRIVVRQMDAAGNVSPLGMNSSAIRVDKTAPKAPSFLAIIDDNQALVFEDPSTEIGLADNKPGIRLSLSNTDAEAGDILTLWDSTNPSSPRQLATHMLTGNDILLGFATTEPDDFLANGTYTLSARLTDKAGNGVDLPSFASIMVDFVDQPTTGHISIVGDLQVGSTLTVDTTQLTDPNGLGPLSFEWFATGRLVEGAQSPSLLLTSDHLGKAMSVRVRFTDGGGTRNQVEANVTDLVNDGRNVAPLASGSARLVPVLEDALNPFGARVESLFAANFSDQGDTGTLHGVVLVGNFAPAAQGTWQWRTADSGWAHISTSLNDNAGLFLARGTQLRFLPAPNFNGTPGALTARLVDNSSTASNGTTLNVSRNGGSSAYSSATVSLEVGVVSVNDAPVAAGRATMEGMLEDANPPVVATVGSLFSATFSDAADGDGLYGVVVVGNTGNASQGRWQWRADDASPWRNVGIGISDSTGLFLASSSQLRFLPAANYHGTPGELNVRLVDSSSKAPNGALLNVRKNGASTAFSSAIVSLGTSVTSVNDAPLAAGSATLDAVMEDATNPDGVTINALFAANFSDIADGDGLFGVLLVGNAASAQQGTWQWRTSDTSWADIDTGLNDSAGLFLAAGTQLRFLPVANHSGPPGRLTVRLVDSSSMASNGAMVDASVHGGSTPYSSSTVSLQTNVTAVNDAPIAVADLPAFQVDLGAAVSLDGKLGFFDPDEGDWGRLQFTLDDNSRLNGFSIDANTGVITHIGFTRVSETSYFLQVQAADGAGLRAAQTYTVEVRVPASVELVSMLSDSLGSVDLSTATVATTSDMTLRYSLQNTQAKAGDALQLMNGAVRLGRAHVVTSEDQARGYVDIALSSLEATRSYNVSAVLVYEGRLWGQRSKSVAFQGSLKPTYSVQIDEVRDAQGVVKGSIANGGVSDESSPTIQIRLSQPLVAADQLRMYQADRLVDGQWTPADATGVLWQFKSTNAFQEGDVTLSVEWQMGQGSIVKSDGFQYHFAPFLTPSAVVTIDSVLTDSGLNAGVHASGAMVADPTLRIQGTLSKALESNEYLRVYDGATLLGTATVAGQQWHFDTTASTMRAGSHRLQARVENPVFQREGAWSDAFALQQLGDLNLALSNANPAWVGRYVMIRVDTAVSVYDSYWNLSEIQVYSGSELISQGASVRGDVNTGSNLTNGDTSDWFETQRSTGWFQVDLGSSQAITAIDLWGRSNRGDRLKGSTVFVSDVDMSSMSLAGLKGNTTTVTWVGTVQADAVKHSFSNTTAPILYLEAAQQSVVLSGSLQAFLPDGVVIGIYKGDNRIASAVVQGKYWSARLPAELKLGNGQHEFKVQIESAGRDVVYTAFTRKVLVDIPAPKAKTVVFASVIDDVGVAMGSIGANTDDATPTVTAKLNMALGPDEQLALNDGANRLSGQWRALDNSGTLWQFEPEHPLSLGGKSLQLRWLGADGVAMTASGVRSFTLTEPTELLANTSSIGLFDDVGTVQGQHASGASSDDATPQIKGQLSTDLQSGEVLRLYNGSTLQATVTPDASGAWSYTLPALSAGVYRWQARVENTVTGQVGAFSPVHVFNHTGITRLVVNEAESPWVGRYVLFRGDDAGQSFHDSSWNPSEFKVYDAFGQLLSQGKSIKGFTNASSLNDGDNSNWQEWLRANHWVQIDLGAVHEIGKIEIFGRTDRADRLKGTVIFASNTDMSGLSAAQLQAGVEGVTKLASLTSSSSSATFNASSVIWTTRDTMPTVSGDINGTLMPGEVLAVYRSSLMLGHAQVKGSTWSFTLPDSTPLGAGTHPLELRLQSASGTTLWNLQISVKVQSVLGVELLNTSVVDNLGVAQGTYTDRRVTSDDTTPLLKGVLSAALPLGADLVVMRAGQLLGHVTEWTTLADGKRSWQHALNLDLGAHDLVIAIKDRTTGTLHQLQTLHYLLLSTSAPTWVESLEQGVLPIGVATKGQGLKFAGALGATLNADEALHIYIDNVYLGNANVNAQGRWTMDLPTMAEGQHTLHWRVVKGQADSAQTLVRSADVMVNTHQTTPEVAIRFNAQQKDDGWVIKGVGLPGTQLMVKWGNVSSNVVTVDAQGTWLTTFYINDSRFGKQAPLGVTDVVVYEKDPDSGVLTDVSRFKAQVDVEAPELRLMQASASEVVAGQVVRLHLNFSETPYQLDLEDFSVSGGTLHNLCLQGTQASLDLLVGQGLQASQVIVGLKMGVWTDAAGNPGANARNLPSYVTLEKIASQLLDTELSLQPMTSHFNLRAGSNMALDLRTVSQDLNNTQWSVLLDLPSGVSLSHGAKDPATGAWRVMGNELSALRMNSTTTVASNVLLVIRYQHRNSSSDEWLTKASTGVVGRFVSYVGAAGSSEDFNNFTRVKEAWNDGLFGYSGKGVLLNVYEGNGDLVPLKSDFNLGNVLNSPGSDGVWASGHGYGVMQRATGKLDGQFRGPAYDAIFTWINGVPLGDTDIITRSLGAGSTFGTGWYNAFNSLNLRGGLGAVVLNSAGNAGLPTATERVTSKEADLMAVGSLNNNTGTPIFDYGDAKHISVPGWGGTSHASPLAAGLTALILEANPNLGFRDVQSIVAYSARYLPTTGGGVSGFLLNGAQTLNGAGLHYSHLAGFGVFDVQAAVALARDWLKPEGYKAKTAVTDATDAKSTWLHSAPKNSSTVQTISAQANVVTTLSLQVADQVSLESINFRFYLNASNLDKMQIRLISPSGTDSILMSDTQISSYDGWVQLTSRRFWGELSKGEWQVKFYNSETISTSATVHSVHMDMYGVKSETNQRYIYTDEWTTTYETVASTAIQKQMRWLASPDGGNDNIFMSAMNSDVKVMLGPQGFLELQNNRIGFINASSVRHAMGGRGDDWLVGHHQGGSLLVGNDGSDKIIALSQNNILEGSAGADWIWFGLNDKVTGGEGADKFILTQGEWSVSDLSHVKNLVSDFDNKADTLFRYDAFLNKFQMLQVYETERFFQWVDVRESSILNDLHAMCSVTPMPFIDNLQWADGQLSIQFNQTMQSQGSTWKVGAQFAQSINDGVQSAIHLTLDQNSDIYTIETEGSFTSVFGHKFDQVSMAVGVANAVTINATEPSLNTYLWAAGQNSTLFGGGGHDVLVTQDHNGSDVLQGGGGADRFVWKPKSTLAAGVSKVLDFTASEGDVLELGAIFAMLNADANTENVFRVLVAANDAYLEFDLNRDSTFTNVYSIQLVAAAANGSVLASDDLNTLYARQVLMA